MKIGTSFAVPNVTDLRELVPTAEPVTIVVGAFAHGSVRACILYLGVEKSVTIDFSVTLSVFPTLFSVWVFFPPLAPFLR